MAGRAGRWRATALAAGVAVLSLVLGGCGESVPTSPPTGVDQLVVPTPDPRPTDFVTRIDNPWLAWSPGRTTTYTQVTTGAATGADPVDVVQTVSAATTTVAGLAATTLTTTTPAGSAVDWFAQDRAGNVWWLGREGEWTAGVGGAEAGLWMPAHPRTGDGFRLGLAPGVEDDRAETTVLGEDRAGVRLAVRTDLVPGRLEERTYVEGTGLTRLVSTGPGSAGFEWVAEESG